MLWESLLASGNAELEHALLNALCQQMLRLPTVKFYSHLLRFCVCNIAIALALYQVRGQALLQDKYQRICAGFEGHVADMRATLTHVVSATVAAAACAAAVLLLLARLTLVLLLPLMLLLLLPIQRQTGYLRALESWVQNMCQLKECHPLSGKSCCEGATAAKLFLKLLLLLGRRLCNRGGNNSSGLSNDICRSSAHSHRQY